MYDAKLQNYKTTTRYNTIQCVPTRYKIYNSLQHPTILTHTNAITHYTTTQQHTNTIKQISAVIECVKLVVNNDKHVVADFSINSITGDIEVKNETMSVKVS